MKKIIPAILLSVLMLCACGKTEAPEEKEATAEAVLPGANLVESAEVQSKDDGMLEKAKAYIDGSFDDFIAEFGEPISSQYAHSCMGPGEDGMHEYDGFDVYTYKEGDSETVIDVDN